MCKLWIMVVFVRDICWLPEASGTMPGFLPKFLLVFCCEMKSVIQGGQHVKLNKIERKLKEKFTKQSV